MSLEIERVLSAPGDFTVTDSVSTSQNIAFGNSAGGNLMVISATASGSPHTGTISVQWHIAPQRSDTYFPMYDLTNTIITSTLQVNRAYPLPDEIFGAANVKIVCATAGQACVVRLSYKG